MNVEGSRRDVLYHMISESLRSNKDFYVIAYDTNMPYTTAVLLCVTLYTIHVVTNTAAEFYSISLGSVDLSERLNSML